METVTENLELTEANNFNSCIGILDVYIHEARNIHNICIYHEQDVYATVYLTNDPKTRVSTQIINGGGKNPVFNQNLRLDVKMMKMETSSLRCEIWMLSRIKNYLEDQLLGFAVVDFNIPDIVFNKNRDLPLEYELSSSDLLHVPAGSVELTLNYEGIMPEHEHPTIPNGKEDEDESSTVSRRSCHDNLESKVDEVGTENGKRVMTKDEEKAVVDQEEIMDMYMKSMMEATEAMVNIKLPSEGGVESGLDNYVETDMRFHESKNSGTNPRVFYGSRAFF